MLWSRMLHLREGLKPERLTLHERHMHRRASLSLEVESQVSVGPSVCHLVVGLHFGRACRVQNRPFDLEAGARKSGIWSWTDLGFHFGGVPSNQSFTGTEE